MKLKEIEKIPWRDRGYTSGEYAIAVFVQQVKGEDVLLIDVNHLKKRWFRIAFTKDDYRTYLHDDGKWSGIKVETSKYAYYGIPYAINYRKKENFLKRTNNTELSRKVYKRLDSIGFKCFGNFWSMVEAREDELDRLKDLKRSGNRKESIEEIVNNTWGMSVKFRDWAETLIPETTSYYLRQDNEVFITCSCCGHREVKMWGDNILPPEEYRCSFCGAVGKTMDERNIEKVKKIYERYAYDIRPYGDKGIMIAYVRINKTIQVGVRERYDIYDVARNYFFPKRKTADTFYNVRGEWKKLKERRSYYEEEPEGWVSQGNAPVFGLEYMIGPYRQKGNPLEYSAWDRYGENIIDYAKAYIKEPALEFVVKLGLKEFARGMIKGYAHLYSGKTLEERFGVPQRYWDIFVEHEGELSVRNAIHEIQNRHLELKEDVVRWIMGRPSYERTDILDGIKDIGTKLIGYLVKQKEGISFYKDYMRLAREAGLDMERQSVRFPKNLREKHDELVREKDWAEVKERIKVRKEKYPQIEKNYKSLKKFVYESGKFLIRPAKSAEEIVLEGFKLRHCVGRLENYSKHHAEGSAYILMMRRVEAPDEPYTTVEITSDGEIRQWYQYGDKKPDKAEIQPWLDAYVQQLQDKLLKKAG